MAQGAGGKKGRGVPGVFRLLRGSGLRLRKLGKDAAGEVFAVALPGEPPLEGVIAGSQRSFELAVFVTLPEGFELAAAQPTTERVLQLLGALNLGLQSQGLRVAPLAHVRGLEGFAISRHVCGGSVSAELLKDDLLALHATARRILEALSEPTNRLLVAVRKAAGVRHVAARRQAQRGSPALIPTFDPGALELMREHRRRSRRRR